MRHSFHTSIMFLSKTPISESFMNTFFKKLGTIVFLFQTLEESMKIVIGYCVETKLESSNKQSNELDDILFGDRSFKSLKLLFSRIVYLTYPDADETINFNDTLKRLSNIEEQRNKYIHSVYWFNPNNKVSKTKTNRKIKNPTSINDHVDFKEMNKMINELFEISYTLKDFVRIVSMYYTNF